MNRYHVYLAGQKEPDPITITADRVLEDDMQGLRLVRSEGEGTAEKVIAWFHRPHYAGWHQINDD